MDHLDRTNSRALTIDDCIALAMKVPRFDERKRRWYQIFRPDVTLSASVTEPRPLNITLTYDTSRTEYDCGEEVRILVDDGKTVYGEYLAIDTVDSAATGRDLELFMLYWKITNPSGYAAFLKDRAEEQAKRAETQSVANEIRYAITSKAQEEELTKRAAAQSLASEIRATI